MKGTRTIPASGRLARWLGVLRWPVVVVWVLAVVLLYPLANGLTQLTNPTASAYLPSSAPSTRVALLRQAAQHGRGQPQSEEAMVVFARSGRLSPGDLAVINAADQAVRRLAATVTGLGAVSPPQRSSDGHAEVFTATVTAPQNRLISTATDAVRAIRRAVDPAPRRAGGHLQVAVTGMRP